MKLRNIILLGTVVVLLGTACTDTSTPGQQPLRTRHIFTQALSGSGLMPRTRIAFDDNEELGMATRWETTDAFKGYYTTPQVQQALQTTETVALFSYSGSGTSGEASRARFEADVADDVDATTVFSFFYPSWRTSGLIWADTRASLLGQKQLGNASTGHLSSYNYLHATGVTDIENASEGIVFKPLLALLRFDLTLQDYDATRDGQPLRFSLQSEGEEPFYHSIRADGQGLEASSYLDLQLQEVDPTASGGEGLAANTLRLYCATAPTTLHPARLSLNVYCSNGTRYTTKIAAAGDATVNWQAGTRYRTDVLVLTRQANADVSVFGNDTQASASFSGSGTQADPYLISSAADLKRLAEQVSGRGNTYSGNYFRLTTDLCIEADTWTPIGLRTGDGGWDETDYPFCAHFDGNGHTVSGQLKGSGFCFGLFGLVGSGFGLKNLHVRADINNDYPYQTAVRTISTGGLVGCLKAGSANFAFDIEGCTYGGSLSAQGGTHYTGGLVGQVATGSLNMSGCINRGSLHVMNNTGSTTATLNLGGLVGYAQGPVCFSDCANYGSFSATNDKDIVYAGGLLGQAAANVACQLRNTANYADLFLAVNSNATIGGLVGRANNGQLHTSANHATLTTGSGNRGSLAGTTDGLLTVNGCCADLAGTGLPLCADQTTVQSCDEKH